MRASVGGTSLAPCHIDICALQAIICNRMLRRASREYAKLLASH
jgi:hypothetical protein